MDVMSNKLQVVMLEEDVLPPTMTSWGAAGYDIYCPSNGYIIYNDRVSTVSLGIKVAIPEGCFGQLVARNKKGKFGLQVCGGIVDSDYRDTLYVSLTLVGHIKRMRLRKNFAYVQLIIQTYVKIEVIPVQRLTSSCRHIVNYMKDDDDLDVYCGHEGLDSEGEAGKI